MPLRFPGSFIKERTSKSPSDHAVVATKFAALPWRFGREAVVTAVRDSLRRLQLSDVELYQLHWPGVWGNEAYIDGLADCVDKGLVRAVGVSNYSGEMHAMHCVGKACMAFSTSEPGVVSASTTVQAWTVKRTVPSGIVPVPGGTVAGPSFELAIAFNLALTHAPSLFSTCLLAVERLRAAHKQLAARGVPLAVNQVRRDEEQDRLVMQVFPWREACVLKACPRTPQCESELAPYSQFVSHNTTSFTI